MTKRLKETILIALCRLALCLTAAGGFVIIFLDEERGPRCLPKPKIRVFVNAELRVGRAGKRDISLKPAISSMLL
jgi:hypothetical protein